MYNAAFAKVKDSRFKSKWNRLHKVITNIYRKYIRISQSLSSNYPNNLKIIKQFEYKVKLEFHIFMIRFYRKLKEQLGELSSSDMSEALYHCDCLLKLLLTNNIPHFAIQAVIYIIGYQYLYLYKQSTASDKLLIQNQLSLIIRAISSNYLPSTSLSFLILLNGYKSIVNDNANKY
ncbi:hypothetical protein CONCODRAFT_13375 [Conidiobolus coronatus NRRL 28638]|uniref:Uncharacterized protein n=1 Tax=Conidiobolus coronatus (strain ATCC 28846 / CBS 209.66 / NRRL 28638) TaxID=796925 RepID=A0A137NQZ7_CONC2|nr:hypothetical protein CONCODRAFT_13375 [Conidiobolus coronatus NRRL 28638]|eukprot:KXN65144.1 hypothetical protein CONCODRAFT_13375 [Conidiobolus coronatus NRRL 28638]